MKIETAKEKYPKLFSQLTEEIDGIRDLIVIDENENDGDVDELDEVDAEDYNYILYLTDTLKNVIGDEEQLIVLIKRLDEKSEFQDFFPAEIDLYGVQAEIDESQIARVILDTVEEMLS